MTETELAYMAGIFDGEGCLTVLKNKTKHAAGCVPNYSVNVIVSMTSEPVTSWLKDKVPGSWVSIRVGGANGKNRDIYRWGITGIRAVELVRLVAPYLVEKSRQAELISTIGPYLTGRGKFPTQEQLDAKEDIYCQLKALHL